MSSEAIRDAIVYASIPEMFQSRMEQYADRVLLLHRHAGTWQTWRGRDMQDAVRRWVSALLALGVNKGDHIAVVSATRMEWAIADLAILHAGAVTVGIYPQLPDDDIAYQLAHSDARMVFVENGAMLDRIRRMRARCPRLERAILFEGEADGDLFVVPRRALDADADPEAFRRAWRAIGKDDLATIVYTSGTTGRPRGARLTHENLCFVVASASSVVPSHGEQDFGVVFLPLTHVLQRVGIYLGIYNGARGAYAESLETLIDTFRELRPTVQVSVPRIWEKMHARIRALIQAAPAHRRLVFHRTLPCTPRGAARDARCALVARTSVLASPRVAPGRLRPGPLPQLGRSANRHGAARVLLCDGHADPRGLGPDRDGRPGDAEPAGCLQVRNGRPPAPRRRRARGAGRRAARPGPRRVPRLPQGRGGDRGRVRRRGIFQNR
jgi:long-subunit acyl-CoA synthetase (AMP-forming)